MVICSWWLVTLVLTNFYVANLTAILNTSNADIPIQTLANLLQSEMHWIARGNGITTALLYHVKCIFFVIRDIESLSLILRFFLEISSCSRFG